MEEILTTTELPGDAELDASLRPRTLEEFLGQERVKEQLWLVLEGARSRGAVAELRTYGGIDHVDILLALSKPFRRKAPVLRDIVTFLAAHALAPDRGTR